MQPRLSSSRKWTALPKEFIAQIKSVFSENFREHIGSGKIEADGRIYPSEILVSVGVKHSDTLKHSHFEVSIEYKKDKDNVLKLLHLAVDAAGSLLDQLFTAEDDHDFPRIWQEVDFEGRKIFVQYTTTNKDLEAEANKLLGINESDELAQGDWEDETTPEQIKASLGIGDDDDEGGGDTAH